MSRLVEAVRDRLVDTGTEPTPAGVAAALRSQERVLGDAEVLTLVERLRADLVGAGPLEPLLHDAEVTDVLVNGFDEVWVDTGSGLVRTSVRFPDETALRRLAQRLAAMAGRRLDDAAPYVDARLPGGVRLHAVLPPIAGGGTCLSLRLPRRRAFTLAELVAAGAVPEAGAALLTALVAARAAFLVTGGTGTGKTTLLGSLLSLVRRGERLVLVEDSAELRPAHDHVVRLEARPPNVEGAGEVGLHDLVRQALRMRPDRLVVGEVRGAEVVHLLAALNTGHEGGCGTLHANAAADVPARLEALACAAGLSREAVHSQLAAALDVVVHLVREPGGPRRIAEVCLLRRGADGLVEAVPAVSFTADGRIATGAGAAGLADRLAGLWRPPGSPPDRVSGPAGPPDRVSARVGMPDRVSAETGRPARVSGPAGPSEALNGAP
ncbi:TadA family conjugal transfer-associated ATPase [Actinomadura sp. HBU206391]|uniref:TadA family conjugal transfer-associated ATPase n=1 Tax=Actinomadura sp. HBU206391 TaxID=2731692 RepID=UPI00164F3E25|nr:TadA family conjugal transfer-associated ATPase [Actinomadura sp. HBU206391]MBC6456318.1 TadA family conjugal transfer-associated ATPase [Actinomadura sp. HBU206391]